MKFLLTVGGIIGIVIGSIAFLVICGLLLYFFVFAEKIKVKKIKDLDTRYEYFNGLLLGECNQILQRLEIISHSNLLYSQIHAENLKTYLEIYQSEDKKAQKAIENLDDYILNKRKKGFKVVYQSSSKVVEEYISKVSALREKLLSIIKPEEDARNDAFKIKEKESVVRKKYIQNRTLFDIASQTIDVLFDKIDQRFEKFDSFIDSAQYDDALKLLPSLSKVISELDKAVDILPDLCLVINEEYPNKVEFLKKEISEMEALKIPLYNINPKKKLKNLKDKVDEISLNISQLKIDTAVSLINSLREDFNSLNVSLSKEKEAKDYYDQNFNLVIKNFKDLSDKIISVYNRIPNYQKIYIFSDEYAHIMELLQEKERIFSSAKTSLDLSTLSTNRQPYSIISDRLKTLDNAIKDTNDLINSFEKYVLSLKNDCDKVFELIKVEFINLKAKKSEFYKLCVNNRENYISRFDRCFELLNNMALILKKEPINVTNLNRDLLEFKTLEESLFKEINDIKNLINECDKMMLVLNKIRDGFSDVNAELNTAEELYQKALYSDAYKILSSIYSSKKDLF